MKKLIMLTVALTFTSLSTFASTGAEKFMAQLQENHYFTLEGEDCQVSVFYNEATSISSGGPIRLNGQMIMNNYLIAPHTDIAKAIVSDNTIVTSWSNGLSSAKIVIEVDSSGKPLKATGSARSGLFFEKKECQILSVITGD